MDDERLTQYGYSLVVSTGTDSPRVVCKAAYGSKLPAPDYDPFDVDQCKEKERVLADLARLVDGWNANAALRAENARLREACNQLISSHDCGDLHGEADGWVMIRETLEK